MKMVKMTWSRRPFWPDCIRYNKCLTWTVYAVILWFYYLILWYSAQFTIRYDTVTTTRRRLGSKLLPGFALNELSWREGRICRFHLFPISSRNFRSHRPAMVPRRKCCTGGAGMLLRGEEKKWNVNKTIPHIHTRVHPGHSL